ncbi:MAG: S8 family serine peptidase [Xanthomonadales bacterium]|nr:S8 family serine peptidase [Xanthomonadales bacterium]
MPTFRLCRRALFSALAVALHSGATAASTRGVVAHPLSSAEIAAVAGDGERIVLRAGAFDPLDEHLEWAAIGTVGEVAGDYAIVQAGPGQIETMRAALDALGIEILGHVPNNAYSVRLNGADPAVVRAQGGVRWIGAYMPGMKIDPALWPGQRIGAAADAQVETDILAFRGVAAAALVTGMAKAMPDAVVTDVREDRGTGARIRVSTSEARLDALLQAASAIGGVAWIERHEQPTTKNSGDPGTLQGNFTGACTGSGVVCGNTPVWGHDLYGSRQVVAVADTGLDRNEAWFTTLDKGSGPVTAITDAESPLLPNPGTLYPDRKVIGYWVQPGASSYDYASGHGTHVAGTVAGDAAGTFGATTYLASTPTSAGHEVADGNAPNAQILMQDIGAGSTLTGLNDLIGTLRQAVAGTARIHTNSWGGGSTAQYDSTASDVDFFTSTYEDLLFVVAAGNDGPGAGTLGSPGTAKNALTVGGTQHAGSTAMYGSSSRGPAADGRIKPDIVAPAVSVVSALADTVNLPNAEGPVTTSKTGTSMATPAIAGNAALVRQFFADGFYPRGAANAPDTLNASGMVMKAVLLNGTNALSVAPNAWPDMNYGWGRAWLDSNLWFTTPVTGSDDTRRLRLFERTNRAGLRSGESETFRIDAVASGAELRATLTWFDPEAAPGAAVTLVNDLDLEVTGPGGLVYRGNVFSAGASTTGGSADALNTVEQVRLPVAAAGSYEFRVIARTVPGNGRPETDTQGYALAVSGAFALPNTAALPAPSALTVSANDGNGVAIGFSGVGAAQGYQLYRAGGTCTSAAAGDFRLVAHAAAAPLLDTRSQGGLAYAYKARAVGGDVEGDLSACVDAVSLDACTLRPTIERTALGANGANDACKVALAWTAAQPACPLASTMTYALQRSTHPYMTAATTIASGIAALAHDDTGVIAGTTYYYRLSATDNLGNTTLPYQSRIVAVTPTSTLGPDPASYLDDVDTHSYMTMQPPWQITGSTASNGSFSYHSGTDGGNYPDGTCAAIETLDLQVPVNAHLAFDAKYNFEWQYDGAVMEISSNGGTTWTDLPPDGGYPTTFVNTGNACGYAGSHGAFAGVSTAASNADPDNDTAVAVFKPFTVNLASYAGQTVRVRWRIATDGGISYPGLFIDAVRLGDPDVIFRHDFDLSVYQCQ